MVTATDIHVVHGINAAEIDLAGFSPLQIGNACADVLNLRGRSYEVYLNGTRYSPSPTITSRTAT